MPHIDDTNYADDQLRAQLADFSGRIQAAIDMLRDLPRAGHAQTRRDVENTILILQGLEVPEDRHDYPVGVRVPDPQADLEVAARVTGEPADQLEHGLTTHVFFRKNRPGDGIPDRVIQVQNDIECGCLVITDDDGNGPHPTRETHELPCAEHRQP